MDNVMTMDYETAKIVAAAQYDKEQSDIYAAYMPCEVEPGKWGILYLDSGTAKLIKVSS
tara:strand:+ start:347 stop:523 length:177 start_codon:yes stop_codon:yes gene_type:complete